MKTTSLLCTGAACCAFVATPAPAHLGGMLDSVKVSAASHGFAADVAFAHAEALRRGVQMVVCKSPDGERCAASGSWRQGWMVFQDADGNGRRSPGEPVVLRERALSRSLRVAGSLEKADAVAFDAAGATRLVGHGTMAAASLTWCREGGGEARRLVLRAGRSLQLHSEPAAACS